ncbi:MAG: dephospho-CoA kinase [Victivallales bacterium]|nr:dephospho-CoA kinase [Victivallales bacterium]
MIIGLTGGVGCGKSTASNIFKSLGWNVFDADWFCLELYRSRDAKLVDAIRTRWGDKVVTTDGDVNRKMVAEIVFKDELELKWLNSVFHPLVAEALHRFATDGENVMCDVPLLYEVGWERDFDAIICVWSDLETQFSRLRLRGWTDTHIQERINCQISTDEKLERADLGIINKYSEKILYKQCLETDRKLRT